MFYLPGVCTYTDTKGKQIPEYLKIFEKKTQYLMNTLYVRFQLMNSWPFIFLIPAVTNELQEDSHMNIETVIKPFF